MSWYGDPDALDRLAASLEADAARVRERAALLRSTSSTMTWRGPAADAFAASLTRQTTLLDRAAGELDDAAAALHRHAAAVRAQLARIRALEHAVTSWLSSHLSAAEHAISRVVELPVSGAREWVEVAEQLRSRGVPL